MTFNGREIFLFDADWNQSPGGRFEFDLRELNIGFGQRRFGQTAEHLTQGWRLRVMLDTPTALVALLEFLDLMKGPLTGFWLPSPLRAATVTAGVSGTQFDIAGQGLTGNVDNAPDRFLWFTRRGKTPIPAEIASVADNGNGTERVTLTGATAEAIDENWNVNRLLYVRMSSGDESAEFVRDGVSAYNLSVVELPQEYAAVETGTQPVYLYHFWADYGGTLVHWRFTSFQSSVTSNGDVFDAKPVTHGRIVRDIRGTEESVELRGVYEAGNPLADFFPFVQARPLWVEIMEAPLATPNTTTVLFTGKVGDPVKRGQEISVKARSVLDALMRKLPGMLIQPKCNYQLFEAGTCKVNRGTYEQSVTIASISGNVVVLNGTFLSTEDNWNALGWVKFGTGATLEVRDVLQDTYNSGTIQRTVWLSTPLRFAVATNAGKLYPGCAKTPSACTDKFANWLNYGGHPVIPVTSLSLRAMPSDTANGNKK